MASDLVVLERHGEVAGLLELAVDAVGGEIGPQPGVVLLAETFEHGHLIGEAGHAVGQPVGERGLEEPAVAAAGPVPARVRLEHAPPRVPGRPPWREARPTAR